VFERVREIGALRSLGMREREVVALFVYESAWIGAAGAAAGAILGWIAVAITARVGIDVKSAMGDLDIPYRVEPIMRAVFVPATVWKGAVVSIVAAATAAVVPAARGARIAITDALRWD
jgi:putative ABC transport system permease protein